MNKQEQSSFTRIKNNQKLDRLNYIVESLTRNKTNLSFSEKSFILRIALYFISRYEDNKQLRSSLEFAYFLILKYSLLYNDFRPLYDFSVNFGLYPIVKAITSKQGNDEQTYSNIENAIIDNLIGDFQFYKKTEKEYTAIKEQKIIFENFNKAAEKEVSYIAPTSYGKSQLIFEHIQSSLRQDKHKKFAIIVPTKSLIAQTYREVRKLRLGHRILTHDEMYNNEEKFVAILTQERALRLLQRPDLAFDILYIDEAHNLFEDDPRNIFLARLIRLNERKNSNQKLVYLSPLINDSRNLKVIDNESIKEFRIDFSIKEPQYIVRDSQGDSEHYNRFFDSFYSCDSILKNKSLLSYIYENSSEKNFIFLNSPRSIEEFAAKQFGYLHSNETPTSDDCEEISRILSEHVHEDYNGTSYVKKGFIYLHGRIPTAIKDYLEYKFKTTDSIRYLIANHVVLQGVNMPISSLFILKGHGLNKNALINLIGRVNRLNDIFGHTVNLEKLEPKIFLVDNKDFNSSRESQLRNKVRLLRSNSVIDSIQNPTLQTFDSSVLDKKLENAKNSGDADKIQKIENEIDKIKFIKETENFLIQPNESLTTTEAIKLDLIRSGLNYVFDLTEECLESLSFKIRYYKNRPRFKQLNIIDKISLLFVKGLLKHITDFEIKRLKNEAARRYYSHYMDTYRKLSLKENAKIHMSRFKNMRNHGQPYLYIGTQFGEVFKPTETDEENSGKVYIKLTGLSDRRLINIALIKIKIEDDFTRNKLKNLISLLYKWELIDLEEYNIQVYGTNNEQELRLIRQGLPYHLIVRLENEQQLSNIDVDSNGNILVNENFNQYLDSLDDFVQFEIKNSLGI